MTASLPMVAVQNTLDGNRNNSRVARLRAPAGKANVNALYARYCPQNATIEKATMPLEIEGPLTKYSNPASSQMNSVPPLEPPRATVKLPQSPVTRKSDTISD